jgi:hypothetical protein
MADEFHIKPLVQPARLKLPLLDLRVARSAVYRIELRKARSDLREVLKPR